MPVDWSKLDAALGGNIAPTGSTGTGNASPKTDAKTAIEAAVRESFGLGGDSGYTGYFPVYPEINLPGSIVDDWIRGEKKAEVLPSEPTWALDPNFWLGKLGPGTTPAVRPTTTQPGLIKASRPLSAAEEREVLMALLDRERTLRAFAPIRDAPSMARELARLRELGAIEVLTDEQVADGKFIPLV